MFLFFLHPRYLYSLRHFIQGYAHIIGHRDSTPFMSLKLKNKCVITWAFIRIYYISCIELKIQGTDEKLNTNDQKKIKAKK